jgi:hypothetical protein
MNKTPVGIILQKLNDDIKSGKIDEAVDRLLNLVESLVYENARLTEIIQQQNDEINRLKGEQGQPEFTEKKDGDISSEEERFEPRIENLKVKTNRETVNQRNQK